MRNAGRLTRRWRRRGTKLRSRPGVHSRKPLFEQLEDRRLLANIVWDGGPDGLGTNWNDQANWVGDSLPGPTDTAVIDQDGTYTVQLTGDVTTGGLVLGGANGLQTLLVNQRALTLNGQSTVGQHGKIDIRGVSGITGTGSLTNEGSILVRGSASFGVGLANAGSGSLIVDATSGSSYLTVADGFTNDGLIQLTNVGGQSGFPESVLTVTSGTLVNAPSGTIESRLGTRPGTRKLQANMDNRGTVTAVDTNLTIKLDNAHHLNSGTLRAAGGDIRFEQSDSVVFNNTGIVDIGAGREVAGWGLEWVAEGSFTGSGSLRLNRGTLTVPADYVLEAITFRPENATIISGSGTLVNRGRIVVGPGTTFVNVPLVNEGSFTASIGNAELTQTFENRENALLRIGYTFRQGGNSIWGGATLAHGFENFGTISLEHNWHGVRLDVTEGTLINHGLIKTTGPGNSTSSREGIGLSVELDNRGEMAISSRLIINKTGASHVNSGVIRLESDGTNVAAPSRALQFKNPAVFENRGSIVITPGYTFATNTDLLQTAGSIDVDGVLDPRLFTLEGGVLRGSGVVKSPVTNSSEVQPGNSVGKLRVEGDYSQSDNGSLQIDLAGPDEYDRLEVTGTASLAGSLDFTLVNNYSPDSSTDFDVLTYGSHSDEFGAVQGTGLGNVALTGTAYAANAFSLTLEPVPEGSATTISQQLQVGWNNVRNTLDDWATLFDLSATDQFPVLPTQLAQILNLQDELANLTLPETPVSNTYEILADALTGAGLTIECMTGDVADIPACADGSVEARFETTLSGLVPVATAQYNDQTPEVLAGLFSAVDLDGDITLTTVELDVDLVFGVDDTGFYLSDQSALDLHVAGTTDVSNDHDLDPVAVLAGTAAADVHVVVAPESRVRDVTVAPADVFATTASGTADVTVTVSRAPLEMTWDANFTVSHDGSSNVTTGVHDITLNATLTLPGLTEQGQVGQEPSALQIAGMFDGASNSWSFVGNGQSTSQYSFYGFAVQQLDFSVTQSAESFSGNVSLDFVDASSELAGLFPLSVQHLDVGFDRTASVPTDFSLSATVAMSPALLANENIPFDPSLEIVTTGPNSVACSLTTVDSTCSLAISSVAILEPDPRLVVGSLASVTLGIANLNVGEVGFGGSVTLSDFAGVVPNSVAGSLTIVSGIEVLDGTQGDSDLNLDLNGATIAIKGEFNPDGEQPNWLDLEVDGEVNFHAMIKDVMELKDFGFKFDMSLQNTPGQFDPSFTFLLNQLSVGEVIIELGDLMILSTKDAKFNFNDTPIATFGTVDVSFPSQGDGVNPLAGMTGTITNLEIGTDLLPKLSEIQGVSLEIPDILAESLQWLPVSITELGLDFHPDLLSISGDGIDIDDKTAFSVIASGNVTPVNFDGDTKFPLGANATVTGLTIDIEKLHDGEFPITNVDSISIGLEPVELVDGFTIAGAIGFGTVPLGASQECSLMGTGDVLFGRILGEFEFDGYGGGVELIVSELGPVAGFIKVPLAIALGQTGFLITGAKGTLQFGQPPLPRITEARQLNGDEFQNPIDRDFGDPAVLQQFLESAASSCSPTWSQAFTLAVSGTFTHAAVAGLLSGEVTLATMVGLAGEDPGLNLMGFGDVNILGVTLAEARLLFDLRDPLNPKIAAAVEAPPGDNILSLFIPAKAEAGALLTTDGIALAVGSGVKAFVDNLFDEFVDGSDAVFDRGGGLFAAVLDAMATRLNANPTSALAEAIRQAVPDSGDFDREEIIKGLRSIFSGIAGVGEGGFNPEAFLQGNPFLVTNDFLQEFLAAMPVALDAVRAATGGSIEQMRAQLDLAAVDLTGEFPQFLLDLLSPISLLVPRREDGTPGVTDGETFTIGVGAQTETFEFDENGNVAGGHIAIPFGPANNVAAVASSIAGAVTDAGLGITATAANGVVKLTGTVQQATIEIAGTALSLLDGPDDIARDALLAFMGVMRDASHDAIEKASSILNDDSLFDPSLTIAGELSPAILGIPLGKPPFEGELILNKRGLAFGMDFSVVKTLNTLWAAASGPLAGTVASILNLLPAPFSDRLFADVRFPFADNSDDMAAALIAMLDGQPPLDTNGNPLVIDPLSDNWAAVFQGTFNVFDIPLYNLGGMMFPPDSPHLLDARIQKVYDDPGDPEDPENPGDENAIPDTPENLNCMEGDTTCKLFTLDTSKFQVTEKEFFDGMEAYGGILVSGGYTVPAFLRDPIQVIGLLGEPSAEFPETQDQVPAFLQSVLDDLAQAQEEFSKVEELAKLQFFFPSFATVLETNFDDYTVETPPSDLEVTPDDVILPADAIAPSSAVDVVNGIFLATGHEFHIGDPVLLSADDPPGGLSSGNIYYIADPTRNQFRLARSRAAAERGEALEIVSAGLGDHSFTRSSHIRAIDNEFVVGDEVLATGANLPDPLTARTKYYVTDVLADSFALAASQEDARQGIQIDFTSTGTGTIRISPESTSGKPRISYDSNLTEEQLESKLENVIGAAFFEGLLDDKLLGIELVQGRIRGDASGVAISGAIPWLGGLHAEFQLETEPTATLTAALKDKDGKVLADEITSPWASVAAEVSIDTSSVPGVSEWQQVMQALGIPLPHVQISDNASAAFRAFSPYFDPLSEDPLERHGGIGLEASLDLAGVVEDGQFTFALTPPTLENIAPGFTAVATGSELKPLGLAAPPGLLDLGDFELRLSNQEETPQLTLGVRGLIKLLGGSGQSLELSVDNRLDFGPNGVAGDLPLNVLDQPSGFLGFGAKSEFSLHVDSSSPGMSVHVDGDLTLPGGLTINGEFDFIASDDALRLGISGEVDFLSQSFEVLDGSFLNVTTAGLEGELGVAVSGGQPFQLGTEGLPAWDLDGEFHFAITPSDFSFAVDADLLIPGLAEPVAVAGTLDSSGLGSLTSPTVQVAIGDAGSIFSLGGTFRFDRFTEHVSFPVSTERTVARVSVENPELSLGEVSIELNDHMIDSAGVFRSPDGGAGVGIPEQLLDLLPGQGSDGMQLEIPSSSLKASPIQFNLSIGSSTLHIPGFPQNVPVPSFAIDDLQPTHFPVPLVVDQFDLGVFRVEGPAELDLAGQSVLRFPEMIAKKPPVGQPAPSFPRIQIPGIFDQAVDGSLVVHADGTFDAGLSLGNLGTSRLGILGTEVDFHKTSGEADSVSLQVRGGQLHMPLVAPIDLPTLRVGSDGAIGQVIKNVGVTAEVILATVELGLGFVVETPLVTFAIETAQLGFYLAMRLASDAPMTVLGDAMEMVDWYVPSVGSMTGEVRIPILNPFQLPSTNVDLSDISFSLGKNAERFELHVDGLEEIDVGFVNALFGSDSFIASNGDFRFRGSGPNDLHFGNDQFLGIKGDASVKLEREGSQRNHEVRLENARLQLPFNDPIDLPSDLAFRLSGELQPVPITIPSGTTLGEFFPVVEFPAVVSADVTGSVLLRSSDLFNVDVIPGLPTVAKVGLPFDNLSIDSSGGFSADVSGPFTIFYPFKQGPTVIDHLNFPFGNVNFDPSRQGELITLNLPDTLPVNVGFFLGDFGGELNSNRTFQFVAAETPISFGHNNSGDFKITGQGEASLDQSGFSGSINDASLKVVGFSLVDSDHDYNLTPHLGGSFTIGIPSSNKKSIDLGFLRVRISGSASSSGSFSFSGSKSVEFTTGVVDLDGKVKIELTDSSRFEGSFSGSVHGGGVSWAKAEGTVSRNGCLEITEPGTLKFRLPGGNCSSSYVGLSASDGYISGGTAFFDANGNGAIDFLDINGNGTQDEDEPSEPAGTTDAEGDAGLFIPPEFDLNGDGAFGLDEGRIVVTGGIDVTTLLPLRVSLTAPAESEGNVSVTPLTTLVTKLASDHSLEIDTAVSVVVRAFGMPDVDLLHFDPIGEFQAGSATAATIFAAGAKVQGTWTQISLLVQGASGLPLTRAADAALEALAERMVASNGTIDLADPSTVASLIEATLNKVSASIDAPLANAAAAIISAANQRIDAVSPLNRVEFLSEIARAQSVAQGTTADDLAAAAQGNLSIEDLLARNTGGGLADRINDAVIGSIVPPQLEIRSDHRSPGKGEVEFDFAVRLTKSSLLPVTVEFETRDGTLVAENGDYIPVEGELTFAPGEVRKSIRVVARQLELGDELFVDLFAPVNASLANVRARGSSVDVPADLELFKSVDDRRAGVGDNVTFTITVANDGPGSATGVQVTDLLPAGLDFVGFSATQGGYDAKSGQWEVSSIDAGSTATLTITAKMNSDQPLTNIAEITASDQTDPDSTPGNNITREDDQFFAGVGQCLTGGPLNIGTNRLIYSCAAPGALTTFVMGTRAGSYFYDEPGITVNIADPQVAALGIADASGMAVVLVDVPESYANRSLIFQAFGMRSDSPVSNSLSLQAPEAPLHAGSVGLGGTPLDSDSIPDLAGEAIDRWRAIGLSESGLQALRSVVVRLSDLPGDVLGATIGNVLLLDADAAGHGWFVDPTPKDDGEFVAGENTTLQATAPAALQKMDALTVVMHEMGHLLGLADLDSSADPNHLMLARLDTGIRRLPNSHTNLRLPFDVNADGQVSPLDALIVIEVLNGHIDWSLSQRAEFVLEDGRVISVLADTDLNYTVTPLDALLVINHLNLNQRGATSLAGEGEGARASTEIARWITAPSNAVDEVFSGGDSEWRTASTSPDIRTGTAASELSRPQSLVSTPADNQPRVFRRSGRTSVGGVSELDLLMAELDTDNWTWWNGG